VVEDLRGHRRRAGTAERIKYQVFRLRKGLDRDSLSEEIPSNSEPDSKRKVTCLHRAALMKPHTITSPSSVLWRSSSLGPTFAPAAFLQQSFSFWTCLIMVSNKGLTQ
jgi:hypothetical protein